MRYTLCTLLLALPMLAQAQTCRVCITSKQVDKFVLNVLSEDESRQRRDTIVLKKGKGTLDVPVTELTPGALTIVPKDGARAVTMVQYVTLMPGEKFDIDYTDGLYTYTGSKFYQQAGAIRNKMLLLEKDYMAKVQEYNKFMSQEDMDRHKRDSLKHVAWKFYQNYIQQSDKIITEYAFWHPQDEGIVMCLPYSRDQQGVIALLSDTLLHHSRVSKYLEQQLEKARLQEERAKAREAARAKIGTGKLAPDFTLNDINGNPFTLSSLRGKYVILDFWGSWCGWCIKGMPKMKEYYAKHKDKMQIVGVDCNDTETKWKAAVEQHQLPWLHVYNPKDGQVDSNYAVSGYPTKVIITPEGYIESITSGESDEFYTHLDELFAKK